jgi:hypothetical protein
MVRNQPSPRRASPGEQGQVSQHLPHMQRPHHSTKAQTNSCFECKSENHEYAACLRPDKEALKEQNFTKTYGSLSEKLTAVDLSPSQLEQLSPWTTQLTLFGKCIPHPSSN